ncbi:MAG: signal recognition particle-docking protein FtsY, partial [Candidatus Micrarchaeota archaeon]|nr:signal recognition particle-docking protein FtsY [Candidatus Micrarchaeota archaeon]
SGTEMPFKILFIGPNGAGKTTSMAKVAHMLLKNGITCIMSASDTFRAAAVEQTVIHAQRLGIEAVKGIYGADPASVAFDAIAHARARGIDVVLIDSAGRQETNASLIEELKKIVRVTKPDLKLFVGESITGNSLLEQVRALNEAVKLDGIILTKLDVDAKGGNTLSILSETDVPVMF